MAIISRISGPNPKGSPLTAAEMDGNITEIYNVSSSFNALMTGSFLAVSSSVSNLSTLQGTLSGQFTGSALISGSLKIPNSSLNSVNSDKVLVQDSTTGEIGWNSVSGVGTSGTSGESITGPAGTSGTSGLDGTFFGTNGTSGKDGTSGVNGSSGKDGTSGVSGTSGKDGVNGSSGTSGVSGTDGSSGSSGTSGTGISVSGTTNNGVVTNIGVAPGGFEVESNLTFDGSLLVVNGNISASGALTASLTQGYVWVGGIGNRATLVQTSSFGAGGSVGGIFSQTGSIFATTNNIQITGSLDINGPMSASLRQGYVWVGGVGNKNNLQIATASLGASLTIYDTVPSIPVSNVNQITFAGATLTNNGGGAVTVTITGGTGTAGSSGTSGISGTSGTSGINGTAGTSGVNGKDGISGTSGTSGSSGKNGVDGFIGSNGSAGTSGVDGTSGTSGQNGQNGTMGTSGTSGTAGTSGTSGTDSSSGTSGTTGAPGLNGSDGTSGSSGKDGADGSFFGSSGTSGTSGLNGENGSNGSAGSSGTSGVTSMLAVTGSIPTGLVRYENTPIDRLVVSNTLTFDGSALVLTGSLFVSGAVSASGINIYSTGTPELTSATNLNLTAGNAVVVTQSPIRLTNYTDAQTGSLTPQNGDMIYNSTTHKFMGYANGTWVQLH